MNHMRALYAVEAFVLRKKILLGHDVFVVLFTEEFGKVTAIAKGLRTGSHGFSRRSAHVQTGNLIRAQLAKSPTSDRYYLHSTSLISGFLSLRSEEFLSGLYFMLSAIDALIPEGQQESGVYQDLKRFFVRLAMREESPAHVTHHSFQQMLIQLGYASGNEDMAQLCALVEDATGVSMRPHGIM